MLNIDFDTFENLFNNHWCDWDGVDGNQCFDLANFYSFAIGSQSFTGATADLIYNQTQNGFYTQIPNSPSNFPVKGDIIVLNWPHVGIATGNNTDANQFEIFQQNDPVGSNCHIKLYPNYDGVIGWLHPVTIPQNLQQELNQCRIDRDAHWNDLQAQKALTDHLNQTINDRNADITTLNATVQTKETEIQARDQELTILKPIAAQVPTLQEQITNQKNLIIQGDEKIQGYRDEITKLNQSNSQLANSSAWTIPKQQLLQVLLKRLIGITT